MPLHHIQYMLGHKNLATTARYISHPHPGDLEVHVMPEPDDAP